MALWELGKPRRGRIRPRSERWPINLAIVALNPISIRVFLPVFPYGMAILAEEHGWGLMNQLDLPHWVEIVAGIVLLDFTITLQHLCFHAIPTLWRLHMVHHADLDIDCTTGLRFHPVEILLSTLLKLLTVYTLGPPPLAVFIFEVLLNATSMFNHSNIFIPPGVDRVLRFFVVTPDMHRVHHSVIIKETNSNFGFNHPWWDWLMGTYQPQPSMGHEKMAIGLAQFREPAGLTLPRALALPFVKGPGPQPLNRH